MTIFICILGLDRHLKIDWKHPMLPRIGEHIFAPDFTPDDVYIEDDVLIVEDIQWGNINNEICPVLFLNYDNPDFKRDYKIFGLN
jgi:hypothetical protein